MVYYEEDIQVITEKEIISLADNMAAAATTFNSHGYDEFIQAREKFIDEVHKLCTKLLRGE